MELRNESVSVEPVAAVVFDFDGTISTLRCGWEAVMRPLMIEYIGGAAGATAALCAMVDHYIDESTGIQTIHQMKWLAEHAAEGLPRDPWWYKDEYNRRLMETVAARKRAAAASEAARAKYVISGAPTFLRALCARGVRLFAASGTDHPDVLEEARVLGVADCFEEIAGAPLRQEGCSKEAILHRLLRENALSGARLAVIGDGKVEIALGKAAGARTLGLASDENARRGVNEKKRARLLAAGADAIAGDFEDCAGLLGFLGLA